MCDRAMVGKACGGCSIESDVCEDCLLAGGCDRPAVRLGAPKPETATQVNARQEKMETPGILGQVRRMDVRSTYYRVSDPDGLIQGIQVDKLADGRILSITEMTLWPFILSPWSSNQ